MTLVSWFELTQPGPEHAGVIPRTGKGFYCLEGFMNGIILSMLIQNASLIHTDIFIQTKPHVQGMGWTESNPIAAQFFYNDQYELGYITSLIGNVAGSMIGNHIDKTGTLSQIILSTISTAEVLVIADNDKNYKKYNAQIYSVNVKANIFYLEF
jgi:hypothetical protein